VCLAAGERHAQAGRESDAIATFESCRAPIAAALEHDAVARALRPLGTEDPAPQRELASANQLVDERVRAILRSPASSLSEAIERLGVQLLRQPAMQAGGVTVSPFTYGTTDLSSVFGRQAGVELESVLARRANRAPGAREADGQRIVRGVYLEREDEIRVIATAKDVRTGRVVAGAETTLPRSVLPAGVSLKPANFETALRDQRILGEGQLVSGDLTVEVWTDRGRRGVVYTEREELTVYYRVNQPAWVRLIYVLQSGEQIPMATAYYVDASKVNQVITYPDKFEIVRPFGVEHIHATAFTNEPRELVVEQRVIAGEPYQVVADGMKAIVRERGLRRKRAEQVAESLVTVTTTPR